MTFKACGLEQINSSTTTQGQKQATLIVADGSCPKIRELLAEALVPVLWLEAEQHPLKAVTAALKVRRQQGKPVETLHWVSHGRPGVLQVGGREITRETLVLYRADLGTWGLKNLALWSCRYGAAPVPISLLEEFIGASVFASASDLGRTSEAITQWKLGATDIAIPVNPAKLRRWAHKLGEKIYTTHGQGKKLGYVDKSDNSFTDLGKFNDGTSNLTTVWGLAFGKDGNLYATQEANSMNHDPGDPGTKIYKVDLTSSTDPATTVLTQAPVEVTTDSSVAGDPGGPIQFHAMDVDSDGLMYALDLRGYIYKVDIATGAATYIAETSKSDSSKITSAMDIAFDVDGNLFAVDGSGALYQISLNGSTTATATQLGSTSYNMLMGLMVTSDNTLYGTNFTSGKLFSINKSTGALTEQTSTGFTNNPHGGDAYIPYTGWPTTPGTPVISNAGDTLSYTEGDGATVIDSSLSISDADDTNIESATVTISSGFQSAEDVLAFSDTSAITGSWNASTGVLTLTGSDTLANYKTALESVTYNNTSDNPNTANRTISWVVNDGTDSSSAVTSTVAITAATDINIGYFSGSATTTKAALESTTEAINSSAIKDLTNAGITLQSDSLAFKAKVNENIPRTTFNLALSSLNFENGAITTGEGVRDTRKKLLYYSVNNAGDVSALSFDPIINAGARFYDLDGDGLADYLSLTLVDGGFGDKDGVKNGVIDDPSTAATGTLDPGIQANDGPFNLLTIADPDNAAPAAFNLNATITGGTDVVNQIGYIVLNADEVATAKTILSDLDQLKKRATILFSSLEAKDVTLAKAFQFSRDLLIRNGQSVRFFSVENTTLDNLRSLDDSGFSFLKSTAKGDGSFSLSSGSGLSIDLALNANDQGLGALVAQAQDMAPVLNVTPFTNGETLTGTLVQAREATLDALTGFYKVVDPNGMVMAADGSLIAPGAAGYAKAALRADNLFGGDDFNFSLANGNTEESALEMANLSGYLAPYAKVQSNTFFAFAKANSDGISHFRVLGNNLFGLEDQVGGGDRDFDDHILSFNFDSIT